MSIFSFVCKRFFSKLFCNGCGWQTLFLLLCFVLGYAYVSSLIVNFFFFFFFTFCKGQSPLHIACENNWRKTVEWIISGTKGKCKVNICNKQSKTKYAPLIGAIRKSNFPCVRAICKACIKTNTELNILESNGLIEAAKCGDVRIWQVLVETLFKMKKINDFKALHKSQMFSSERWHKLASNASLAVKNLLNNIDHCYKSHNFHYLVALLGLFLVYFFFFSFVLPFLSYFFCIFWVLALLTFLCFF